jgi:hypothetical protein
MLIQKNYNQEKGIEKAIFESSNVLASYYNENSQEIEIIFYKPKLIETGFGESYTYKQFTAVDYVWFRNQDSQGKELFSYVKQKGFPFFKNGKYPIVELIEEKKLILENKKSNVSQEVSQTQPDLNDIKPNIEE